MVESWEEYSDGCSVDSYKESPSPSSSSEESANEDEPDANSISGPSALKTGRTIASLDRRGK